MDSLTHPTLEYSGPFPVIIAGFLKDSGADETGEIARAWRKSGYQVTIQTRKIKAKKASALFRVVVLLGKKDISVKID